MFLVLTSCAGLIVGSRKQHTASPLTQEHEIWKGFFVEKHERPDSLTGLLPLPSVYAAGGKRSGINPVIAVIVCSGILLISNVNMVRHYAQLIFFWGIQRGVAFGILSLFCFYLSFYYLRMRLAVENTPTSSVRAAAMGRLEMKGVAVRKYSMVSPLGNTPCVYFRVKKYRRTSGGSWRLYSERVSGPAPFYLKDHTGRVLIDPLNARIENIRLETYRYAVMLMPGGTRLPIPDNEKWTEEIIYEGAPIYVFGSGYPARSDGDSMEDRMREKLKSLKGNRGEFMRYDLDKNGRVDGREWELARDDAREAVLRETLSHKTRPHVRMVVARPRGRSLPFIIAGTGIEEKLTGRYLLAGIGCFTASVIFALIFTLNYGG